MVQFKNSSSHASCLNSFSRRSKGLATHSDLSPARCPQLQCLSSRRLLSAWQLSSRNLRVLTRASPLRTVTGAAPFWRYGPGNSQSSLACGERRLESRHQSLIVKGIVRVFPFPFSRIGLMNIRRALTVAALGGGTLYLAYLCILYLMQGVLIYPGTKDRVDS